MLADQVLVDRPDDVEINLDGVEVEQRYAEFMGGRDGDRAGFREVILDDVGDERLLLLASRIGGLLDHVFVDDAVLHQAAREARQNGLRSGYCHGVIAACASRNMYNAVVSLITVAGST